MIPRTIVAYGVGYKVIKQAVVAGAYSDDDDELEEEEEEEFMSIADDAHKLGVVL